MQDLQDFIQLLHDQQKENNVTKLCWTNAKVLHEFAKAHLNIDIKFVCGYLVKFKNVNFGITEHCWCEYKGVLLDPSYEYKNVPNKKYVKNFKELSLFTKNHFNKSRQREFIKKRMEFQKKFNRCNAGTMFFSLHKMNTLNYIHQHRPEWVY